MVMPFYIPTESMWEFWWLHIFAKFCVLSFLFLDILIDMC